MGYLLYLLCSSLPLVLVTRGLEDFRLLCGPGLIVRCLVRSEERIQGHERAAIVALEVRVMEVVELLAKGLLKAWNESKTAARG